MILKNLTKFKKTNKIVMIIIDLSLVIIGYYLAYLFKFSFEIPERNLYPFIRLIPFIALVTLMFFDIYGLLSISRKTFIDTVFSLGIALFMILLSTMALSFFFRGFAFPRSVFFIGFIIQLVLLSIWRYIIIKLLRKLHGIKQVMIIGNEKSTKYIAKKLVDKSREWYNVKYLYYNTVNYELKKYIKNVDTVIISSDIDYEDKIKIINLCQKQNIELFIVPDIYEMFMLNAKIDQFDDVVTFKIEKMELTLEQRIIKRTLDIIISLLGIIITLPIMIIVSIAIKLDSKGDIIYKQERLTVGEKKFYLYKFRTMVQDAEKITGPIIAGKCDPRITKVGKFLRTTRLDELPQLFNVLKGQMSIVGPRPERPYFVDKYSKSSPNYYYRMNVKAGLTGLAQILGKYATSYEEKLKFDLLYIRNYSIILDLKIIMQTIKVLFLKEKSEGVAEDKELELMLSEIGLKTYSEIGVTKIE
ncbi:sugar transferase [Caloranaerobacter ferrireducens]|uniref:sugar transferase n=1 Tax=Caloranaerobacter ferrireducens TaxID=1323370 RepID=UPI00084CECE2|nr:sugar transferase [Caloranaerobacter ferrireducens]